MLAQCYGRDNLEDNRVLLTLWWEARPHQAQSRIVRVSFVSVLEITLSRFLLRITHHRVVRARAWID